MKKIIFATMFAIVFSVGTLWGQSNAKATYIINDKKIENFNGSQLVGEIITDYSYDADKNIHIIFTSKYDKESKKVSTGTKKVLNHLTIGQVDSISNVTINLKKSANLDIDRDGVLTIINGAIVPDSEVNATDVSKIISVKVIKDKNNEEFKKNVQMAKQYTEKEINSIVVITTK